MCAKPKETGDQNRDQKFWLTFRHANVGMAVVLPSGYIQRANPELCILLGYAEGQLDGLEVQSITHHDDLKQEMRLIKHTLEGKIEQFRVEKRFVKSDGTPILASVSATLERDANGDPLNFIYMVQPIASPVPDVIPERDYQVLEAPSTQLPATDRYPVYEEIFFRFLEAVPMGLLVIDGEGLPYYANNSARDLLGIGSDPSASGEDPLAGAYRVFVAGTDEPYPEERMPVVRAVYGDTSSVDDMEIRRPEGSVPVKSWGAPILNSAGELIFSVAAFSDISDRKAAQDALEVAHDRYIAICDNIPNMVSVHDLRGMYRFASVASARLMGYESTELVGTDARVYIHPEDVHIIGKTFQRYIAGSDEQMRATYRVRRKDGEYCWVETGARPVTGTYGLRRELLFVTHNLAEGEEMQALLLEAGRQGEDEKKAQEMLAYLDALTGVKNRRAVDEQLEKSLGSRRASTYPLGILMIDVDRLRVINDKYGHTTGDDVLKKVAATIRNACRAEDFVGRYGEDEFLVVLANTDAAGTVVVGEKLLNRVQTAYWADTPVVENITVSIGAVCISRYAGLMQGDLLEMLDAQLYEAKQGGRNRMVMNARRATRNEWAPLKGR